MIKIQKYNYLKKINNKINSMSDIDDFVFKNESFIDDLIKVRFGKVVYYLDQLDEYDEMVFRKAIFIETLIYYNIELFKHIIENLEDRNLSEIKEVNDLCEYMSLIELEFILVESIYDGTIIGRNLNTGAIKEYVNRSNIQIAENEIFFGILENDVENDDLFYIDSMIILKEYEYEDVFYVFSEYRVDSTIDVLVSPVLDQRITESLILYIDDLMYEYSYTLSKKYTPDELQSFYYHITILLDYFIENSNSSLVFDIDYYKFAEFALVNGLFHIEGEIDSFLGILEIILSNEANLDNNLKPALQSIRYTIEKLFILKNNNKHYRSNTSRRLVNEINNYDGNNNELNGIFIFANICESLSKIEDLKITKVKRIITKKSLRELESELMFLEFLMLGNIEFNLEDEINLIIAMLLANNIVDVDDEQILDFYDRYNFFCSPSISEFFANIITSVLRKETFEEYIGKSLDNSDIFDKTIDSIKNKNPAILKDEKYGDKALYILYLSGMLKRDKFGSDYTYTLGGLGEIVSSILNDREDNFDKKVINVDFSK